jgi:hypothetical protein
MAGEKTEMSRLMNFNFQKSEFFSASKKKNFSAPGLPDGLFSKQKYQFWVNLGGSCNVRCWYILWPFGIFSTVLGYFHPFWYVMPRKIWQPCSARSNVAFSLLLGLIKGCHKKSRFLNCHS